MKIGTLVRLKLSTKTRPGKREVARVLRLIEDVRGGVYLDNPLEGFWTWNVEDLEPVPSRASD